MRPMLIARGVLLVFASVLVLGGIGASYQYIENGLSAQMMGFESEPAEGWAYWRWYFIKRSIWGIFGTIATLVIFSLSVLWGWLSFFRALKRF